MPKCLVCGAAALQEDNSKFRSVKIGLNLVGKPCRLIGTQPLLLPNECLKYPELKKICSRCRLANNKALQTAKWLYAEALQSPCFVDIFSDAEKSAPNVLEFNEQLANASHNETKEFPIVITNFQGPTKIAYRKTNDKNLYSLLVYPSLLNSEELQKFNMATDTLAKAAKFDKDTQRQVLALHYGSWVKYNLMNRLRNIRSAVSKFHSDSWATDPLLKGWFDSLMSVHDKLSDAFFEYFGPLAEHFQVQLDKAISVSEGQLFSTRCTKLIDEIIRISPYFSAGVVNVNGNVQKHVDRGDSEMGCILVGGDFTGGHLILYELGIKIAIRPGDAVYFSSAVLHHAVTSYSGTRYSLVLFLSKEVAEGIVGMRKSVETSADKHLSEAQLSKRRTRSQANQELQPPTKLAKVAKNNSNKGSEACG